MELNSNQIQEINPHRYPFALVDRIIDYKPGEYLSSVDIFLAIMLCQVF